jgi:Arm DNA-binding domain
MILRPLGKFACLSPLSGISVSYLKARKRGAKGKMATKIGLRDVRQLPPNSILWDSQITGLCVRRQHSETVTWSVVYRNRDYQQKWFKLGRWPILTPHLARQEAVKILRAATLGEDPSEERREKRHAMSVAQLCDDYATDMKSDKLNGKKASTIKTDMSRIGQHIKPGLGNFKVALCHLGPQSA